MTFESDEKRLKEGMKILEKLNFLHKAEGSFSEDFRSHTIETLFGSVWTRSGLEIQERSIITLAGLIALNRENELRLHFRGARNLGFSKEKLEERLRKRLQAKREGENKLALILREVNRQDAVAP